MPCLLKVWCNRSGSPSTERANRQLASRTIRNVRDDSRSKHIMACIAHWKRITFHSARLIESKYHWVLPDFGGQHFKPCHQTVTRGRCQCAGAVRGWWYTTAHRGYIAQPECAKSRCEYRGSFDRRSRSGLARLRDRPARSKRTLLPRAIAEKHADDLSQIRLGVQTPIAPRQNTRTARPEDRRTTTPGGLASSDGHSPCRAGMSPGLTEGTSDRLRSSLPMNCVNFRNTYAPLSIWKGNVDADRRGFEGFDRPRNKGPLTVTKVSAIRSLRTVQSSPVRASQWTERARPLGRRTALPIVANPAQSKARHRMSVPGVGQEIGGGPWLP